MTTLAFADTTKTIGPCVYRPLVKHESFQVDDATVKFEPGVFQGTGEENRVNICITSLKACEKVLELEKQLSGIPVCSAVKEKESMQQYVKCKLLWNKCRFFNIYHELVNKPPVLAGHQIRCVFSVKGSWTSHGQQGLSIEITDIQLIQAKTIEHKSPFL